MSAIKLLGNHAPSFLAGSLMVNPSSSMYDGIHHVIATAMPTMNTGDTSEVLRLLAGLVIGILSKFIYGFIDKKFKNKPETSTPDPEK